MHICNIVIYIYAMVEAVRNLFLNKKSNVSRFFADMILFTTCVICKISLATNIRKHLCKLQMQCISRMRVYSADEIKLQNVEQKLPRDINLYLRKVLN